MSADHNARVPIRSGSPDDGHASFDALQDSFVETVREVGFDALRRGTLVVLPSITFPTAELRKIIGIQYYEERMLYTLLLLRNPELRIVYLSSVAIDPSIVDYYLDFLDDPEGARARLSLISVGDPAPAALTTKVLTSPDVMAAARAAIDGDSGYVLPFNVTPVERTFAEDVHLPLFGPHPDLISLGSKSGSRRVAKKAGVPILIGYEDLYSLDDVEHAIREIKKEQPEAEAVVVKLNNGFSGQGNAIVDLRTLRFPLAETPTVFCASEESWSSFGRKISDEGAIVEELVRAVDMRSPSVQLRIAPGGSIETLSTHDQILGGPDDQVYLGCRFPARSDYRRAILDLALETAKVLAAEGVFGPFGIDFIVVPRKGSAPDVYLSEINLRNGGTTHPFAMARLATEGLYDFSTGELVADGSPKFYVSTDNLKSPAYIGMTPAQAIHALEEAGLGFELHTRTGATLHLLGALPEYGKLGLLCVAGSYEGADDLYANVVSALDLAAERRK